MPTLHLGVIDFPHPNEGGGEVRFTTKKGKVVVFKAEPQERTTGDIAQYLEDKYHIMEVFYEDLGGDAIAKALERSTANAIEAMMGGSNSASINLTAEGEQEIEEAFRVALTQQEFDNVIPGVPTQAALDGVSHSFADPHEKRASRPSFVDTGTYRSAFKAWVE